jgi:tetratricopeptide (TPR) repeat protein
MSKLIFTFRYALAVLIALAIWPGESLLADDATPVKASVTPTGQYTRILFEWPGKAKASASLANDVAVVQFDQAVSLDTAAIEKQLEPIVAMIRKDADGRALRFALKAPARLHTSLSGRRFAVDFVSPGMTGNPPEIVDPDAEKMEGPIKVALRVSELQTLTRLAFDWPEKAEYATALKDGRLKVTFNKPARIDLTRFQTNPPAWIKSAKSEITTKTTTIVFEVEQDAKLSDRAQGNSIEIDVIEPPMDGDALAETADEPAPPPPQFVAEEFAFDPPKRATSAPPIPEAASKPVEAVRAPKTHAASDAPKTLLPPEPAKSALTDAQAIAQASAPPPAPEETPLAAPANAHAGPLPASWTALTSDLTLRPTQALEAAPAPGDVSAEIFGRNARIAFGFSALPKAAIFRRDNAIWLVFETSDELNVSAIAALTGFGVRVLSAPQRLEPDILAFRLAVASDLAASADAQGKSWVLTIGSTIPNLPAQIPLVRDIPVVGLPSLRAIMRGGRGAIWLNDPDLQDRIAAILAPAPARGVAGGRRFVEFDVLPSLQGLGIRALADDITIAQNEDGVAISRPKGLALSHETPVEASQAQAALQQFVGPSPDFSKWGAAPEKEPNKAVARLLRASAGSPAGMSPQRMALAQYYIAHDLAAEALGVLRLIAADDLGAETSVKFRLTRAIAHVQMARMQDAVDDLSLAEFSGDPNAALWRGMALAGQGNWREARDNLTVALRVLKKYPDTWASRARLALAEAQLAQSMADDASRVLAELPAGLPPALVMNGVYLRGKVSEMQNRNELALTAYGEAMGGGVPQVAVKAELAAALLKAKLGKAKPEETIEALEKLRFRWRGDSVELETVYALGKQYLSIGRQREGLQALASVVRHFPDELATREIQAEMQKIFAKHFLSEKVDAMPPIQALALFYDFKDLTPVGADGDEMIRKLADRLVSVDLLPQAAELLQHQVDNRLDGVARASVATRLGLVYLIDRKPEKALSAIRGTREVRLPDDLIAQRRLIEARALSELQMTDDALDVLADDLSEPGNKLRADILWSAQRWRDAGQKIEEILGEGWKGETALSNSQRADVMRVAVAYALSENRAAIDRIRSRFAAKMKDSPDARSFTVVTQQAESATTDIRALVTQIAAVDTLKGFMDDFKSRYGAGGSEAPATN